MKAAVRAGFIATILTTCLIPTHAQADIVTVVTSGVLVSKILGEFEDTANRLIQNAGQQGDMLGTKLGDEMRVATRNASIALGDQQDKLFDNLDREQQGLLIALNGMIDAANQASGRATSIAEVLNLNLIEFTNRAPFTHKVNFYISSVQGITQVYSHSPYDLHVRGLGVGIAPGDRKYVVSVALNGTELPGTAVRPVSATDLDLEIANNLLEPYFKDDAVVQATLTLTSRVTAPESCWGILTCSKENTYEVPLTLILMPRYPGTLSGTEPLTSQTLDTDTHTTSATHHTVGCHSDRPCDWTQTIDLAQDEFAFNVRYACSGQCGWDYKQRPHGPGHEYDVDFDILNDGHKVVVYRHNDGEHDTTVTHYVDFHKQIAVNRPNPLGPFKLQYGQATPIDLSPANTHCGFELHGKLATKQEPYIDSGLTESADHLLVKNGVAQLGNHCRVTLSLQQR